MRRKQLQKKAVKNLLRVSLLAGAAVSLFSSLSYSQVSSSNDLTVEGLHDMLVANPAQKALKGSAGVDMSVASVPQEYECPLFSNSPYDDVLKSMNALEVATRLLPDCREVDQKDNLRRLLNDFNKNLAEAKAIRDSGDQSKFATKVKSILDLTKNLQTTMVTFKDQVNTSSGRCYPNQTDSTRQVLFKLNDGFQSMLPLALDFAAKNPALSSILQPVLPSIAGASAISNSISVLETSLKEVPFINVNLPENRLAIIQNTCSFMKMYNRASLLTDERAGKTSKITEEIKSKINSLQIIKQKAISDSGISVTDNAPDLILSSVKNNFEIYLTDIKLASSAFILTDGDSKSSGGAAASAAADNNNYNLDFYLRTCDATQQLYKKDIGNLISGNLSPLSWVYSASEKNKTEQKLSLEFLEFQSKQKILAELNKKMQMIFVKVGAANVKGAKAAANIDEKLIRTCSDTGRAWIDAQNGAIVASKKLMATFDLSLSGKMSAPMQTKLQKEGEKISNLEDNRSKFEIYASLAKDMQPSEFAKRVRDLPRYLFSSPRDTTVGLSAGAGPVLQLLKNTEAYFNSELNNFGKAVSYLTSFERKVSSQDFNWRFLSLDILKQIRDNSDTYVKNQATFAHLNLSYIKEGSAMHQELCDHLKLAKDAYIFAVDHVLSNMSLCKMINPVLRESVVDPTLKSYCRTTKSTWNWSEELPGYIQVAQPLFVKYGPLEMFQQIMKKNDDLKCDQTDFSK